MPKTKAKTKTHRTLSGPGRMGSMSKMKKSLKSNANQFVRTIPGEGSITVRFLENPEDWEGYYEHWVNDLPLPCTTDECEGCNSDDDDERRKNFRYLANAYVVDDQKVRAVKIPKTLAQQLVDYHDKFKGTLLDRDYDLKKTGSGKNGTRYMASPDAPSKMNLKRFEEKKLDLQGILQSMIDGDELSDEDDEPKKKKGKDKSDKPKKTKDRNPWEDDDEPPKKKKKSSASKSRPAGKRNVKKSNTSSKRRVVRK